MTDDLPPKENLVSSKQILERTGISRATLNNYIKVGILPKPLVQRPMEGGGGTKKIGYFPLQTLERIEFVQRLKREGKSMGEITDLLRLDDAPHSPAGVEPQLETKRTVPLAEEPESWKGPPELRLNFEEISFPSYFLNYDFDLAWINRDAELRLFKGIIKHTEGGASQNVFRLLFHWEFHRQVANWKDLVQLHMAHAKLVKPGKTWISRLYRGISEGEISVLEKIYDQVNPLQLQTIRETYVSLLSKEGSSDLFRVISFFAKNGILLIYAQERSQS
jgi:DNA-binding transcriptional MerR regulator